MPRQAQPRSIGRREGKQNFATSVPSTFGTGTCRAPRWCSCLPAGRLGGDFFQLIWCTIWQDVCALGVMGGLKRCRPLSFYTRFETWAGHLTASSFMARFINGLRRCMKHLILRRKYVNIFFLGCSGFAII